MRKAIFAVAALLTCFSVGCYHNVPHNQSLPYNDCQSCGQQGSGRGLHDGLHHHGQGQGLHGNAIPRVARLPHGYEVDGPPGPPTGTYAYPYYTVRAPRDFLLNNPPSIGP